MWDFFSHCDYWQSALFSALSECRHYSVYSFWGHFPWPWVVSAHGWVLHWIQSALWVCRFHICRVNQWWIESIFFLNTGCSRNQNSKFPAHWQLLREHLHCIRYYSRRRQWQPTPVFLPGESQGRGSLVGCHLWGRTNLDTTEAT